MKVFISLPMNGIDDETVKSRMEKVKEAIFSKFGDDTEVADSFIEEDAPENSGKMWYLAKSIEILGTCDAIILCPGYKDGAKGCMVEGTAAICYGLKGYFIKSWDDVTIESFKSW